MNPFKITYWILLFVSLAVVGSCDPGIPPHSKGCRISKIYWEDQWHKAYYYASGRLRSLEADSSKILFHYDGLNKLIKAEVFTGDPSPRYRYEFIHGPFGITHANFYYPTSLGTERIQKIYHYAGPAQVDYVIHQEYGIDSVPGFEITYRFSYSGGNVVFVDGLSSVIHTQYISRKYDKKSNPFRILASAVGNPLFFPVCRLANFPVADYDISFLNLFSVNNPLSAQYSIVGGGDPEVQRFFYTYHGAIARKIVWNNTSYGTTTSEDYAFEFECGRSGSGE